MEAPWTIECTLLMRIESTYLAGYVVQRRVDDLLLAR